MQLKFTPYRGSSLTIITLFVLAGLIGYYYQFYLPDKIHEVDRHHFRVLQSIGINIEKRLDQHYKEAGKAFSELKTFYDLNRQPMIAGQQQFTGVDREVANTDCYNIGSNNIEEAAKFGRYLLKDLPDSVQKNPLLRIWNLKLKRAKKGFFAQDDTEIQIIDQYYTFIPKMNFDSILRDDVFEHIMLVHSLKKDSSSLLMPKKINGLYQAKLDSIVSKARSSKNNDTFDVQLAGETFRLYLGNIVLNGKSFFIAGLLNKSKHRELTHSIPSTFVVLLVFFVLFITLSLPLIKFTLLNNFERIQNYDVLLTFVSLFLGTGLLVLFLQFGYHQIRSAIPDLNELQTLAKNTEDAFRTDVLKALETSIDIDRQVARQTSLNRQKTITDQNGNKVKIDTYIQLKQTGYSIFGEQNDNYGWQCNKFGFVDCSVHDQLFLVSPKDKAFKSFSYHNKESQLFKWTNAKDDTEKLSLIQNNKDRKYISDLTNGKFLAIHSNGRTIRFAMEPVFSKISGAYSLEVSKYSEVDYDRIKLPMGSGVELDDKLFAVISYEIGSLLKPVVPEGYGFAFLDQTGKTLFNANHKYNGQENFIEECEQNSRIATAMMHGVETEGETSYHGKDIHYYLHKIEDWPFYIVAFKEKSLTQNLLTQAMSVSTLLLILFVIIIFGLAFIHAGIVVKGSKLLRSRYFLDWLKPKRELASSYRFIYITFTGFAVLLLILDLILKWRGISTNPIIFLTAFFLPILIFPVFYAFMNNRVGKQIRWYNMLLYFIPTIILIVIIDIFIFIFFNQTDNQYGGLKLGLIQFVILIYFLANYQFKLYQYQYKIYNRLKLILLQTIQRFTRNNFNSYQRISIKRIVYRSYVKAIASWIIISSVLPSYFIFNRAYDIEEKLIVRYQTLKVASLFARKVDEYNEALKALNHDLYPHQLRELVEGNTVADKLFKISSENPKLVDNHIALRKSFIVPGYKEKSVKRNH